MNEKEKLIEEISNLWEKQGNDKNIYLICADFVLSKLKEARKNTLIEIRSIILDINDSYRKEFYYESYTVASDRVDDRVYELIKELEGIE